MKHKEGCTDKHRDKHKEKRKEEKVSWPSGRTFCVHTVVFLVMYATLALLQRSTGNDWIIAVALKHTLYFSILTD